LNKKYIEDVPRYFFIENPERLIITGCPHLVAKLPFHPDGTKGYREYDTDQAFYLSNSDVQAMSSGNYRLMHLLNFKLDDVSKMRQRTASFISEEPNVELKPKFLHWLPVNVENVEVEVVMPDGTRRKGLGEPELLKLNVDSIVQFERFGFVRLHKKDKDKLEFWFTHS